MRTGSSSIQIVRRLVPAGVLASSGLCLTGCLERTLLITSEPPGAVVWLNDQEIGRTPLETDFTFFGTYDVRLHKDGYEPLVTSRTAKAPFYELPVIDLAGEALPTKIETNLAWSFELTPLPEQQTGADPNSLREQLLNRAAELRDQTAKKAAEPSEPAK